MQNRSDSRLKHDSGLAVTKGILLHVFVNRKGTGKKESSTHFTGGANMWFAERLGGSASDVPGYL